MVQRRRFSAEYKREAVAMLDAPSVSASHLDADVTENADTSVGLDDSPQPRTHDVTVADNEHSNQANVLISHITLVRIASDARFP
jgi:hypothetical protein